MTTPVPILVLDQVTNRSAGHPAVDGLSLSVATGAIYGLLGPNGAGKTTTIRMILDIIEPDAGSVRLFGEPSGGRTHTARIGYLPEERGLYRKMRVLDRSEEHTSELQSPCNLVCRLLLEKKKKKIHNKMSTLSRTQAIRQDMCE